MKILILGEFGLLERVLRLLVSFALLAAVLVFGEAAWLALVSLYPFFTALLSWDPLYALLQGLFVRFNNRAVQLNLAEES